MKFSTALRTLSYFALGQENEEAEVRIRMGHQGLVFSASGDYVPPAEIHVPFRELDLADDVLGLLLGAVEEARIVLRHRQAEEASAREKGGITA